jgi:ABC-2 type transport system ATP-binding protein
MMSASVPSIISIEALCKTYRGASQPALDRVDLTIAEGDFFALLGPNGAGKTTLISILCGLFAETSGLIRLRSAAGAWLGPRAARSFLGLVPQELAFYPTLSVSENLRYFGAMQGLAGTALRNGVDAALAVGRLQSVTDRRAEMLSGGLKRRLSLAIGVVHSPRLLVLDEPTAGVDAQSRRFLGDELRRLNAAGMTIIYTSHYLDEVQQLCNSVAVIDHGRVIAHGDLHELLQRDVVTLGFSGPPSVALISSLGEIPAVTAVRHDGDRIALVTASPAQALTAALAMAGRHGITVTEATMGHRDLEALFFQLTGKALRDSGADPLAA